MHHDSSILIWDRRASDSLFRLEAENYRTLPRADLLLARGRTIVKKYIAPGATRAVPLSEPVRERILAACGSELVGPGLFVEAQVQVWLLAIVSATSHALPNPLSEYLPYNVISHSNAIT